MNSISLLRRLALIAAILLVTLAAAGLARNARIHLLPPGSPEGQAREAATLSGVGSQAISSPIAPAVTDRPTVSP